MSTEQTLYGLKGNIIYSKSSKQLEICENGYLICEDGKVKGVYPFCRIHTPIYRLKITVIAS